MSVTTVTVTRAGHHYRFTLERGEQVVAREMSIDRGRALEIVQSNPDGAVVDGELTFEGVPAAWTWQATVEIS